MSILYLISSLPALDFDAPPPLTSAVLLQSCRAWMSAKDSDAVEALLFEKPSAHPFVAAWIDKDTILRNTLVNIRARASGQDATLWTRDAQGCDKKIESDAEDAVLHHNPLQKAKEIDKIRWQIAEELQGHDPLSIKTVFAYAIKLAILTRWSARTSESGQRTFEELTAVPMAL